MLAYKKYVMVKEPGNLVLTGLPFHPGQRIEVVMIAEDEEKEARVKELQALFKKTQALPEVQTITDGLIAEEVEKYRTEK